MEALLILKGDEAGHAIRIRYFYATLILILDVYMKTIFFAFL